MALIKRLREWVAVALTSNFTTTAATATSTALTFNIAPNEVWVVRVACTVQCSSTGGVKVAVSAPASCTIEGWYESSTSAIATLLFQRITAINTLTATATHTVATTPGPDTLEFNITAGANGGAVTIQFASVTAGQTTTVFAGSGMVAQRAA